MEPLDYLRALRRRWVIVLAAALIAGAGAWLTAPTGAPTPSSSLFAPGTTYEATQNLMVDRQWTSTSKRNGKSGDTTNLPLLAVLATSGEVPLRVVEQLGLKTTPSTVADKVEVEADEKLEILSIASTGSNPNEVAALVDAFAEETLRLAAERNQALRNEALNRAKATAEAQQARLRQLDARLLQLPPASSEARLVTAEREALLKVYGEQQAVLQELQLQPPVSPGLVSLGPAVPIPTGSGEVSSGRALQVVASRRARAGLGMLLGFGFGCALALFVDRVDTRVRGRREAEQAFGLPVVAELPRTRPLTALTSDTFGVDPETADAYGRLGLAVLHSPRWVLSPRPPTIGHDGEEDGAAPIRLAEGPARLVLVASPGREDARAAVTANLAASLAAAGRSVIAVDCDPERPRLAELLGVRVTEPSSAYQTEPASKGEVARQLGVRPSAVRGVWAVMPRTSRGADLAADGQLMPSYLEWGDIVLVDAGPILSAGEAGAWAVEADAVLIVTEIGRTTAETAALTHEHLAHLQARVLGVVLVDGVARTARGRPRGAPSLPPAPPWRGSEADVEATVQRPRPHVWGHAQQNGDLHAPSPPKSKGERVAPVLEVLVPETSTAAASRPPGRIRGEQTTGDGPLRSVSRPPWADGAERDDPKS